MTFSKENELRALLEQVYSTAVQDADGVRSGRKGYVMRHDEVPRMALKEVMRLFSEEVHRQVTSELQRALNR